MAVPGYQEFMLPLLKLASDGSEHSVREAMDTLAAQMGISAQDRQIMLPSGTQTRYYNRVTWATTYLTKSGLLEKTGRGRIRITPRGRTVLAQNPPRIDNAFLEQFPEYQAFKTKHLDRSPEETNVPGAESALRETDVTPEERLEAAYGELREALADDLLKRVRGELPEVLREPCGSPPPGHGVRARAVRLGGSYGAQRRRGNRRRDS